MDILKYIGIGLIYLLQAAVCVSPFVALYFSTKLGKKDKINTTFGWEITLGIIWGIMIFWVWMEVNGGLIYIINVSHADNPFNLSFGQYWAALVNPFTFPYKESIAWVLADEKLNRLLIMGIAPLGLLITFIIKAFKRPPLGSLTALGMTLFSTWLGFYLFCLLAWLLVTNIVFGLILFLIIGGGGGSARTHHVKRGDTVIVDD